MLAPRRPTHTIDPTQQVVFFPTFGRQVADGWEVSIHGALFRAGVDDYRKRIFLGLLRRVLKASHDDFQTEVFRSRIEGFLLREQPGKRLSIDLGTERVTFAKRTRRSGHVRVKVRLGHDHVESLVDAGHLESNWLRFRASMDEADPRDFSGTAHLIPREGVSVISDIDDTLKHTGVKQRKVMLANTFFNDFQPILGMESLFRTWAKQGAVFHYVSSSPWQLYGPLQQLFDAEGYPRGTFHLKAIRFRDPTFLRLFIARRLPKRQAIASILRAFPQRRFILVGDSGEKDPEIYGYMARHFGSQVAHIYIRNVPQRPMGLERSQKAFREVPGDKWHIFREPTEIDPDLNTALEATLF